MSKSIKSVITLSVICIILAVILGFVNAVTLPIIEAAEASAVNDALRVVYPDGEEFTEADLSEYEGVPASVTAAYTVDDGGCVVKLTVTGYATGMVIMCGISPEGEVIGAQCLSNNETPTIGGVAVKTYGENFLGVTISGVDAVDTVAGATITTKAYRAAVKDALGTAAIISGGSYDARSEEEIKLDEALPSAEGVFETMFFAYEVEDLTALYEATNGTGYVFVFGDEYIGISSDGATVSDPESENAVGLFDKLIAILSVTSEEQSLETYTDVPTNLKTLEKTNNGDYIVVMSAKGYDASNKYSPTKKPIVIKLAITAEGKVICCETTEQYESENYGAACGESSYYSQYNGKDSQTYDDVDAISGATVTSNAYNRAVGLAINFILSIEGGAE